MVIHYKNFKPFLKKDSFYFQEETIKTSCNSVRFFKVEGTDNLGNTIVMEPGKNYKFPGDFVIEKPIKDESV